LLVLLTTAGVRHSFGQGVGISEISIVPHASAILELRHESGFFKGLLIPRMTTAERLTIATDAAAAGLVVYDTETLSFWYWDGIWRSMAASPFGTANQLLGINAAGDANEYKTLLGTTNRISVVNAANSITLSAPQDIHTGANPQFVGLYLTGNMPLVLEGLTNNEFETSITLVDPTQDNIVSFPDRSGTVVLSGIGTLNSNLAVTTDVSGQLTTAEGAQPFNVNSDAIKLGVDNSDALTVNATSDFNDAVNIDGTTTISSTGSLDVDGATTLDQVTINTADGDFSVSGSNKVLISSGNSGADAIQLSTATGNVDIEGTGVEIDATTGGISLDAGSASNISTSSGDIDISAAGELDLDGGTTVAIDGTTGVGISSTANDVSITGADNVNITGTAAGVLLQAGTDASITGANDVSATATVG
ncbi:MAG: hypothetical protein WD577_06535, partial [Bacteroidales bacterium]